MRESIVTFYKIAISQLEQVYQYSSGLILFQFSSTRSFGVGDVRQDTCDSLVERVLKYVKRMGGRKLNLYKNGKDLGMFEE